MRRIVQSKRSSSKITRAAQRVSRDSLLLVGMGSVVALLGGYALYPRLTGAAEVRRPGLIGASRPPLVAQSSAASRAGTIARLNFQPEANAMRRRLGRRFLAPGLESTTLTGTVSVGSRSHAVVIIRSQDDDTERVSLGLDGGSQSLTWDGLNGAANAGVSAGGGDRALAERVALDSADQFILAQLRGASYYTVARAVMPEEAHGSDSYTGPVWDVVRVGEPIRAAGRTALSGGRMFHINSETGLIDKVYSEEGGSIILAEISGWVNNGGEIDPTHIRWKQGSQTVMDLAITRTVHGPKR